MYIYICIHTYIYIYMHVCQYFSKKLRCCPLGKKIKDHGKQYMESTFSFWGGIVCPPSLRTQLYGADGDKLARLHRQPMAMGE
jgi:hypothetical protein